jgi:hypothetical protein
MDLASPEVELAGLALSGNTLRATLSAPPGGVASHRRDEMATGGPDSEARPEDTSATAEPPAMVMEGPSDLQDSRAEPETSDLPPAASPAAVVVPAATAPPRPVVTAITIEPQTDRSTVVTVEASAPLAEQSVRELFLAGDPPRQVLRFDDVNRGETLPESIPVGSVTLAAVRTIHDPVRRPGQLWVVLELAGVDVEVASIEQPGDRVEITLRPSP